MIENTIFGDEDILGSFFVVLYYFTNHSSSIFHSLVFYIILTQKSVEILPAFDKFIDGFLGFEVRKLGKLSSNPDIFPLAGYGSVVRREDCVYDDREYPLSSRVWSRYKL